MSKTKYITLTILISIFVLSTTTTVLGDDGTWNVAEGDKFRWTTFDRYYDITDQDKTIDQNIQSETIDSITYQIEYWNASQGAYADDIPFLGGSPMWSQPLFINIQSNAYAIQIWGYEDDVRLSPLTSYDMVFLRQDMGNNGDFTTLDLEKPIYNVADYPKDVYPVANYTVVFLSRYEFEYLNLVTTELESQGELDTWYYRDVLGDGKMFKFGFMVNFSVLIANNSNHQTNILSGSADSADFDITYNRYAHTDDPLSLQIDTTSSLATKVRLGIVYYDLIPLDEVIFETDITITGGIASFDMYSSLASMNDSIQISLERLYQGPASRRVSVFICIYNEVDQYFADNFDQKKGVFTTYNDRIPPETNKTLLAFYRYEARFLESDFTYQLGTEYELTSLDITIKSLGDTAMDSDTKDDIEYIGETIIKGGTPVEVLIPNYLDLGLVASVFTILSELNIIPPTLNTHGIYIPSAINHLYSSPVDNILDLINEMQSMLENLTAIDLAIFESIAVAEILSTMSFVNLMIIPTSFNYVSLKNLINDAINIVIDTLDASTEEYDLHIISNLTNYYNIDVTGGKTMTVEVDHNIMPYFYDVNAGPTQVGMKAEWSEDFFQKMEIIIVQPEIDRVRIISIEKVPLPSLLDTILEWLAFIGSIIGIGVILAIFRKKIKKPDGRICDPLINPSCKF